MANENPDVYVPGQDITGHATTAVTGKRFVKITGNRTDGNVSVAHADAAGRVFGVTRYDAALNGKVAIARGNSRVTFVRATGVIAAFAEVEVGANGTATTLAAGVAVGYAITGAVDGADAEISLY